MVSWGLELLTFCVFSGRFPHRKLIFGRVFVIFLHGLSMFGINLGGLCLFLVHINCWYCVDTSTASRSKIGKSLGIFLRLNPWNQPFDDSPNSLADSSRLCCRGEAKKMEESRWFVQKADSLGPLNCLMSQQLMLGGPWDAIWCHGSGYRAGMNSAELSQFVTCNHPYGRRQLVHGQVRYWSTSIFIIYIHLQLQLISLFSQKTNKIIEHPHFSVLPAQLPFHFPTFFRHP